MRSSSTGELELFMRDAVEAATQVYQRSTVGSAESAHAIKRTRRFRCGEVAETSATLSGNTRRASSA